VCKLYFPLSGTSGSLVQHWYGFRVSKTSLSGNDPLIDLVLGVLNSKCALVIYYFMLQDKVGLGSK
jgi:hypothetical protein